MAAPELVLLPPTPTSTPSATRPSPTSTATTSSTPSTPVLSAAELEDTGRLSSESAVFSIYSMYGRPESVALGRRPLSGLASDAALHADLAYRAGAPKLALNSHVVSPRPVRTSTRLSVTESQLRASGPVYTLETDGSEPSSSPRSSKQLPTVPRQSSPEHFASRSRPSSAFRPPSAPPTEDALLSPPTRTSSRLYLDNTPGRSTPSPGLDPRDLPLPPSNRSSFAPRTSSRHASAISPAPSPAPRDPNGRLSPAPPPPASPDPRSGPSSARLAPTASAHSLVPSEGEDSDSFFVRSTYAQLDQSGVKGDGFVEGVERTRARVGPSRASELHAEGALGDAEERVRELTRAETAALASLDRYGFFAPTGHERLVGLSTAALRVPFAPQAKAATGGPAQAPPLAAIPPPRPPAKEQSRIGKWSRMLQPRARDVGQNIASWDINPAKAGKLRSRVYKGIPDRWRAAAWPMLMARFANAQDRDMERLRTDYRAALDKPSEYDIQIDLDVPRTITGHVMFKTRYGQGQRSLFHVLHCFSLRCETCGYVQGMGPIAATLLCYLEPETVYAALVRLHDAYRLHDIFAPGFPGLLEAIYVQERLTEQFMPDVYAAFKKHMVSTTSYATKWYITLFANSVPFQTQLRLWDAFFLEGPDTFVVIAVAVVWVFRDNITSNAANFETVLSLLSSFFVPEDEDSLLAWIGKVLDDKKIRGSMASWRAEWKQLVASGKDSTALL